MTLLSVLGLLFLVVASLYVPPVQRAVVKTACDALSDSAMSVSVSDFRLRFPLRLDLSDGTTVHIIGASQADYQAAADFINGL